MANRRVSKRRRPRPKRTPFRSIQAATTYARGRKWKVTETVYTKGGARLQVVTPGGPRTLKVPVV